MASLTETSATLAALRRRIQDGNLLHGAHLALATLFALGRIVAATPALSAEHGARWHSSPTGRGAALFVVVTGVASLVLALVAWWRSTRDPRSWILLAALALSLTWRERVDVFDVLYWLVCAVLCAYWYGEERPRLREDALQA